MVLGVMEVGGLILLPTLLPVDELPLQLLRPEKEFQRKKKGSVFLPIFGEIIK